MRVKKRLISFISSFAILGCIVLSSFSEVSASENELKKVDGSYLTMEDSSTGYSSNSFTRGLHLMTGECSITNAARDKIYAYASTTANHDVDYIAVIVYVDVYNEATDEWWQIDCWMEEADDDYFIITSKTLTVERGHYYRVHADHFARKDPDPIEETFSYTDGVWLP